MINHNKNRRTKMGATIFIVITTRFWGTSLTISDCEVGQVLI